MKTNFNFTKGEWIGAMALAFLTLSSYLIYYLYDGREKPRYDFSAFEAEIVAFEEEQACLADSVAAARTQGRTYERPHYTWGDTNPRNGKYERKPMYEIVRLDLNRCDTDAIKTVPQFGSKRAAKLVEYRDKLGGFYSFEQLKEVYVLQSIDTALLRKHFFIRPDDVRKININAATYKELIQHPYFDAYLTKTILAYRGKNGQIKNLQELQQITHAYPELIERLQHYVVF
ncbi:MAG: helix-hairpin-helix domain-containing protein [Bacteroidales bacterium]|nr:helix-hairpin-helix domain-containing protein [Bacteroidales bacterium]